MTFEQWWESPQGATVVERTVAKSAWDYQQTIIDELQYLNNLQQDRIEELQAKVEWLQSVINNGMLPEGYEIKQRGKDNEQ